MPDAEILSIIYEVVNEFSVLKNKNFVIRLNHTLLLKAILLHCGIPTEKHNDIYTILSDARVRNKILFGFKVNVYNVFVFRTGIFRNFK